MKKSRRSNKKKDSSSPDCSPKKADEKQFFSKNPPLSLWYKQMILAVASAIGVAYLITLGHHDPASWAAGVPASGGQRNLVDRTRPLQRSTTASVLDRLTEEWPSGGLVSIKSRENDEDNRGLFANTNIPKGAVVAAMQFDDPMEKMSRQYPNLKSKVDTILNQVKERLGAPLASLSTSKILAILQLIEETHLGEESTLISYVESLPTNVSGVAWYWTEEEKRCVVPRYDSERVYQELPLFHHVMTELKEQFPLPTYLQDRQKLEWALLMMKTRGFGSVYLPILDMANHDPRKAAPPFVADGTAYFIATHNIKAGEEVYNNYGISSPVFMAETYGFVDDDPAYFEVPSISEELLQTEKTKNEPLCAAQPMTFFGNVTEEHVVTKYSKSKKHSVYFKPYMPTELAYACIRVLLQTERDTDVARFIAEKMEFDYNRYHQMANAPQCQSDEGNFPLIRAANRAMAKSLFGALQVAKDGRDWIIPYPDIPTYIKNYPES